MSQVYSPEIELASKDAWRSYQEELVRAIVLRAYRYTKEFPERLERAGLAVDELKTPADLAEVPLLSKEDLPDLQRKAPPFGGLLAGDVSELRRIFVSPGPILDPEGTGPDFWGWAPALWACGFRSGDRVYNTFSYHLTPAGAMMEEGLRALGCTVAPGGVGNTDAQVEFLSLSGSTGYCGTPQFLWTLLDRARTKDVSVAVKRAFVSGAPLSATLRDELERDFGVAVFQGYGTADAGAIAYECEHACGWHVAPGRIVEIVEETGEIVVSVHNETYPLVRLGTGDVSSLDREPCACGRTTPRLLGFQGRVGEGVKVRGMFVHPRQIADVLDAMFEEAPRFQAWVSSEGHYDAFVVRIEGEGDAGEIAARLKDALKLRIDVELVPPGTLAEGGPRIRDERTWD